MLTCNGFFTACFNHNDHITCQLRGALCSLAGPHSHTFTHTHTSPRYSRSSTSHIHLLNIYRLWLKAHNNTMDPTHMWTWPHGHWLCKNLWVQWAETGGEGNKDTLLGLSPRLTELWNQETELIFHSLCWDLHGCSASMGDKQRMKWIWLKMTLFLTAGKESVDQVMFSGRPYAASKTFSDPGLFRECVSF